MLKRFLSQGCFLVVLVIMMVACTMPFTAPTPTPVPVPVPILVATPVPAPPQEISSEQASAVVIPPYAVSIEIIDASGKPYGRGSAFLVDREKRLFITNAHVVQEVLERQQFSLQIEVAGVRYQADVKEDWVNWWADAAIVRAKETEGLSLPTSALLGKTPAKDSKVRVAGYLSLAPYATDAFVVLLDSEWGVTSEALAERALLMDEFLMSRSEDVETFEMPKELRSFYYRHYIVIEQKQPEYEQRFRAGTSGMSVTREGGEVVAMISAYLDVGYGMDGGYVALAVPAEEIKKLRDKVIGMFE